ncbi:hypothetical protein RB195_000841 [Necator americanus]|uniref:Peptidase A2 domain-containing protein n=1 Tax=Necator americanus TaxID=51031 RepID=A0ABR1DBK2_NECAM
MDPETKSLSKVDVLLDTGAEISFVDSTLAAKLHLPVIEERRIKLHTFGSQDTKEQRCKLVRMEVWDEEGTPHLLQLLTHDILTRAFKPPQIHQALCSFRMRSPMELHEN